MVLSDTTPLSPWTRDQHQSTSQSHLSQDYSDQDVELQDTAHSRGAAPSTTPDSGAEFKLQIPIPTGLSDLAAPLPDSPETDHVTYTAIVTDPQEVSTRHGRLRPRCYPKPRHTEILVGITVYNEQRHLLHRTLKSVWQNINHLTTRTASRTWGRDSWKKVVVCVIVDGIQSADSGLLDLLTSIGVYQNGLCRKTTPGGEEVTGHLFEYSSRGGLLENGSQTQMNCPIQLMLLLKSSNLGKLNSYRWLYNGFAKVLDPTVVVHIDVGTKIGKQALHMLWKTFDIDPQIAAACGELTCSLSGNWLNLLNPIVAAQNFEYKVGFQLDRKFESATGFLSLLPGACSAYRYVGSSGKPLEDMLLGDPTWTQAQRPGGLAVSPVNLNRHLADDRVICFRIICKPKTRWRLKYVAVSATTDIPMTTTDFINQRRRWLNGAFFSSVYVLKRLGHVFRSDHSTWQKLLFCVPLLHGMLSLVLAWFSLAAFLLTTFSINDITGDPPKGAPTGGFPFGKATPIVNAVIQIVYLATILFQFILALGSRPRNHRIGYVISFAIFGLIQTYLLVNLAYLFKRVVDYKADDTGSSGYAYIGEFYADIGQSTIIVAGFSVFGVYILSALIAFDPLHLLTSFAQFLFISSSYVNILNIYAFSNTHDVSWGRKARHDTESGPTDARAPGSAAVSRRFTFSDQDPNVRSAETQRDDASPEAINADYQQAVARLQSDDENSKHTKEQPKVLATADTMMEFRTILLASYIFSNIFVCLIVLNDSLKILWWLGDSYWHKVWFFRIWLWANSVSFLVRFVGCIYFQVERIFKGF